MRARPMTAEDLWRFPRVGAPAPSPDGKQIVVPVTTYSTEKNEGKTRLWLLPADARNAGSGKTSDPARPLTMVESSTGQPAWSPEGKRLAFVRKPGGKKDESKGGNGPLYPEKPQLYLMPLDGGEPERLTDLPLGVADPRWFPDGKKIAFVSPLYVDGLAIEKTAKIAKEREENPVKAAVTESRVYRYWDQWLTEGIVHHIFVLDLETKEIVDLIPDSKRWFEPMDPSGQYKIAPDGSEIAFSACRTKPPHDPLHWGVFKVAVPRQIRAGAKAAKTVALTDDYPADAYDPAYSPDGKWILFGMQREHDFYADRMRLVAYNRTTRRHTILTEDWDGSAMNWTFGDNARTIYFAAEVEARIAYFTLDLPAALKTPKPNPPKEIVRGGMLGAPRVAGGRIFSGMSTLSQPSEVVSCALDGKGLRPITAFTASIMQELKLSAVTEETFIGAEGDRIQMFLLYPPGEKPTPKKAKSRKRYPLVHMIHGGPHGAFPDDWHWRWNAQAFAAPGYLVALVNFHGSTGFGEKFTSSILGRWGDQPYDDIIAATDHLIDRGLVDEKRMAITGGSYGGYLVSWIATQTDRFAAIVNHAGVCDFQTQYGSDITQGRARSMGGEPWENQEGMDRYNPMRHAAGFRSPMLVIHGEKDYRVPYYQGLEIYNVYKAMKLPARLVCYPDENHWILKPRNSLHWYQEVYAWLDRWIGAMKAAKKGKRKK